MYQGQAYGFDTLLEAQAFLDSLPSCSGVEVVDAPVLFRLVNAPGAPLSNWRQIIDQINRDFDEAGTVDRRSALLATFKATMDIVESTLAPEHLESFREARRKHYSSFIVQEALVGEHVCIESLHAITAREIEAGRMPPDHALRQAAENGMSEPHLSRAELERAAAVASEQAPRGVWQRLKAYFGRG
jgi:hypothetical protein